MRDVQDDDQNQIQEELAKFINLLQNDSQQNSLTAEEINSQMFGRSLTKKLSVILSASEPESSRGEKQNSNPSANRSFESNQQLSESQRNLFECLMKTNLSGQQLKLIEKLKKMLEEQKCEHQQENRIQELQRELQSQKVANSRMINILLKMDKKQKQRQNNLSVMVAKYQKGKEELRLIEAQLKIATDNLEVVQNDNQFMKELIMHANENYEGLERRYRELENRMEKSDITTRRKSIKKSSADNLLKSAVTKKKSHSPAHSEVQHSPSRDDSQQIYRKMILRTLKMKPKNVRAR